MKMTELLPLKVYLFTLKGQLSDAVLLSDHNLI